MIELTAVVAVIVGLVEAIKRTSNLSTKYAPYIALFFGITWYTLVGEMSLAENIFSGIVAGLSASGLYSQTKVIMK